MKKLTQQNKGITLIALVITIIVLLILAAVSIATLTGENGILTKASKAKENTETEEEKEQIRLAYTAALANNKDNFEVTVTDLGEELAKLTSEAKVSGNEGRFTIIFTKSNYTHTYTLDSEGIITGPEEVAKEPNPPVNPEENWGKLADQITAENYGDSVAYDIDLDNNALTNDWKIFYKDPENGRVFLIAADYLDYTKNGDKLDLTENNGTGLKKAYEENEKYSLNWDENKLPTVENQKGGIDANLFKATGYDITKESYSSNTNAKCVSTLLNTNNWTEFINDQYADKAIGSPTLEMWVASWNEKGNNNATNGYTKLTVSPLPEETEAPEESGKGYTIDGLRSVLLSTAGTETDETGYYDSLYFPHRACVNKNESIESNGGEDTGTTGYWLASPNFYSEFSLCGVRFSGEAGCDGDCFIGARAIRPIVCLRSEIKGNQESGVWKLATK